MTTDLPLDVAAMQLLIALSPPRWLAYLLKVEPATSRICALLVDETHAVRRALNAHSLAELETALLDWYPLTREAT